MNCGPVLGLDWGTKRIGVAISDPEAIVAHPHATYRRKTVKDDLDYIGELVQEKKICAIIIGMPINMNGSRGLQANRAREFKDRLEEKFDIPVRAVDERLTTAEANRVLLKAGLNRKSRKKISDKLAATLILQRYLDQSDRG